MSQPLWPQASAGQCRAQCRRMNRSHHTAVCQPVRAAGKHCNPPLRQRAEPDLYVQTRPCTPRGFAWRCSHHSSACWSCAWRSWRTPSRAPAASRATSSCCRWARGCSPPLWRHSLPLWRHRLAGARDHIALTAARLAGRGPAVQHCTLVRPVQKLPEAHSQAVPARGAGGPGRGDAEAARRPAQLARLPAGLQPSAAGPSSCRAPSDQHGHPPEQPRALRLSRPRQLQAGFEGPWTGEVRARPAFGSNGVRDALPGGQPGRGPGRDRQRPVPGDPPRWRSARPCPRSAGASGRAAAAATSIGRAGPACCRSRLFVLGQHRPLTLRRLQLQTALGPASLPDGLPQLQRELVQLQGCAGACLRGRLRGTA